MASIGLVAYVWGALHQDRLLVDVIAPTVTGLRRRGLARRFWFDRYDARGPHVIAVVTTPEESRKAVEAELAERVSAFLAKHPSWEEISAERLARLHEGTRGRRQCEPDGRPGFAANNSFEIFEPPAAGYPFQRDATLPAPDALWDLLSDLALWTIGHLALKPGSPALPAAQEWLASVHRQLLLAGLEPEEYFQHHATSLLPDLFPGGERPEEVQSDLAKLSAGLADRETGLSHAWRLAQSEGPAWPGLPACVRLLPKPGWTVLREIDHTVLKQLGVPVALHIPLLLEAWSRSRRGPASN